MELKIQFPKKVAAVFGGQSTEHDASIFSFKNLYADIQAAGTDEEIELSSIYYIMRNGRVLVSSIDLKKPAEFYFDTERLSSYGIIDAFSMIKENNEFVYLICDGPVGTDGRFVSIAENYGIKGNFGSPLSFSICKSKFHMDRFVADNYFDIKIPNTFYISSVEDIEEGFARLANKKIVVKPNSLGSSIHIKIFECNKKNQKEIKNLVKDIFNYDHRAIIQEYIQGDEYGCYCMEKNGDVDILAVKQFFKKNDFLSTKDKYKAKAGMPDVFIQEGIGPITTFAQKLFKDVDCRNFSRMDFIITPAKEVYFLENNCDPALKGFIGAYKEKYQSCSVYDMLKILIKNEYSRKKVKTNYYFDFNFL